MFEAVLRIEFLLCEKPTLHGARGGPPPGDRLTVNFRAKLYAADAELQRRKLGRTMQAIPSLRTIGDRLCGYSDQKMHAVSSAVGQAWIDWLEKSRDTMFGLSTWQMARNLGVDDWYATLYRFESQAVHASDFNRFLHTEEGGGITPTLYPDTEATTLPIRVAAGLVIKGADLVNCRFRLPHNETIRRLGADLEKRLAGEPD
jgi:hypothetical protein